MGYLLMKSLEKDELSPVVDKALYYTHQGKWGTQPEHFLLAQNFWDGLDSKVERLLDIVDKCITKYKEENVLF